MLHAITPGCWHSTQVMAGSPEPPRDPGVPWGGGAVAAGACVCSQPTRSDVPGCVMQSPVPSGALPGQRVLIRQAERSQRDGPWPRKGHRPPASAAGAGREPS